MIFGRIEVAESFSPDEWVVLYTGDCLDIMQTIPRGALQLVVTSPFNHKES